MSLPQLNPKKVARLPVVKRLYDQIKQSLLKERLLVEERYAPFEEFVPILIDLCDFEADVSDDSEEDEITLSSSEEAVIDEEAEEETSEEFEEESDEESEEGEISESSEEEEEEKPKPKKHRK